MNDIPTSRKNRAALWIVLAVIAALLFACVVAALAGAVGYAVGRSVVRSTPVVEPRVERVPRPDVVPVPEMPGMASGWALVLEVTEDSPADRAGLRPGDFIVSVEGESLSDETSLADLIRQYEPGDEVELVVWRDGRERTITVTLGRSPRDRHVPWLGIHYRQVPGVPGMRFEVPSMRDQRFPFSGGSH